MGLAPPVRGLQGPGSVGLEARPCVWGLVLCGWGLPRARLCPVLPAGDKGEACVGAVLPFVAFYEDIRGLGGVFEPLNYSNAAFV